jgi:hypothetical protein
MFHPKFGLLKTIKRPPDWAAAAPIEVAQTKTRIKKSLMLEVNLEFMAPMLFRRLVFGQRGVHQDPEPYSPRIPAEDGKGSDEDQ